MSSVVFWPISTATLSGPVPGSMGIGSPPIAALPVDSSIATHCTPGISLKRRFASRGAATFMKSIHIGRAVWPPVKETPIDRGWS